MSVLDKDAFGERVNYAVACILAGRTHTRGYDNCFEMSDGDAVAVAVYRRSLNNRRLAERIWSALNRDSVMRAAERLKDVPTRKLAEEARKEREGRSHRLGPPNPDPNAPPEERPAAEPVGDAAGGDDANEADDHPLFALAGLQPQPPTDDTGPARP